MKAELSDPEAHILNQHIAELEKRGNIQIVLAVVKRSDSYVEIPWKAFAMITVFTGFLVFIMGLFNTLTDSFWLYITIPFFAGIISSLATLYIPSFARFFLSAHRAGQEVKQYAESLFLSRELYATETRSGLLMYISIFEKRVFLLPDKGLQELFTSEDLDGMLNSMIIQLKQNNLFSSFEAGLKQLDASLKGPKSAAPVKGKNEIPDDIIEEEGL